MGGSDTVLVPGARRVRATLDSIEDSTAIVVACPPHPQYGGNRADSRLRAVSRALAAHAIDCLRFDYGEWDEGLGELEDARNAVRWAAERYGRVGLFGYSFGGAIAIVAAASVERTIAAVSVLAPSARPSASLDATAALEDGTAPVMVLYGRRDETVEWKPIVDRARERNGDVVELDSDHGFVGREREIGNHVASFFARHL